MKSSPSPRTKRRGESPNKEKFDGAAPRVIHLTDKEGNPGTITISQPQSTTNTRTPTRPMHSNTYTDREVMNPFLARLNEVQESTGNKLNVSTNYDDQISTKTSQV